MKALELGPRFDTDLDLYKGKYINDAKPYVTNATINIQPDEWKEQKEGEHLFIRKM